MRDIFLDAATVEVALSKMQRSVAPAVVAGSTEQRASALVILFDFDAVAIEAAKTVLGDPVIACDRLLVEFERFFRVARLRERSCGENQNGRASFHKLYSILELRV